MEVLFQRQFLKDIKKLQDQQKIKSNVLQLIDELKELNDLSSIKSVKRLKSYTNAYRIRIGDYRIGFFLEGNKIIFARIVKRNDIYKVFP